MRNTKKTVRVSFIAITIIGKISEMVVPMVGSCGGVEGVEGVVLACWMSGAVTALHW